MSREGNEIPDIRVIRVGGSLLTWEQFSTVFKKWLLDQPPSHNVLIAGGGPWVELLRQASKRFDIAEAEAHAMCLQALRVTASLVGHRCNCCVEDNLSRVQAELSCPDAEPVLIAFDVSQHLQIVDAARKDALPKSWKVTSDSIAARIAADLSAQELLVLKSSDCPCDATDFHSLGEVGYVDPYFATAAQGLNVRFVNLRGLSP